VKDATSGILRRQQKGDGMPEIKIVTEVAGRICATPVQVGGTVADGDEIVVVEAMKMEIPVPSPASGTITSLLVKIDDLVAEGQAIAVIAN
jgi:biotin carboxyl carrier protein